MCAWLTNTCESAQQLARRQRRDVAEVEQQRAPLVAEVDVQAGVAEGVVDEAGFEEVAHGRAGTICSPVYRVATAGA